ncbi:MAG: hypothetical protein M1814_006484 [Vezdaea aestivalis]|nr:MAG: hypothetical protein M1814_006484 [Vezdaea aestivalis]
MGSLPSPEPQVIQQSLKTRTLELEYERSTKRVDAACQRERNRQLRLQTILLQNDNERLQRETRSGGGKCKILEQNATKLSQTVAQLEEKLQAEAWNKSKEIDQLKIEVQALEEVSANSAKLLAEKLALTRELSSLRPELEHLRTQSATNQNLLSEKLSLEHQLSTLEVKLELEQRATKRLSEKKNKATERDALLADQVDNLKKELAKAKKEQQTAEKDSGKVQQESENRIGVLEGRVEALKTKLRSTKEQLKDTKADLKKSEVNLVNLTARAEITGPVRNVRKRKISALDHDETIGTPDGLTNRLVGAKKDKRSSTLVGEKSTFSITPFLSRTASLAPEIPPQIVLPENPDQSLETADEEAEIPDTADESNDNEVIGPPVDTPSAAPTKKRGKRNTPTIETADIQIEALVPVKPNKSNARSRKPTLSALEAVPEEGDDENALLAPNLQPKLSSQSFESDVVADPVKLAAPTEPKVRKRKLLGAARGKTLFDDDDTESKKAGNKSLFAGGKNLASLAKPAAGGSKARVIGTSAGGFGQFSPRKKAKKALNRSILDKEVQDQIKVTPSTFLEMANFPGNQQPPRGRRRPRPLSSEGRIVKQRVEFGPKHSSIEARQQKRWADWESWKDNRQEWDKNPWWFPREGEGRAAMLKRRTKLLSDGLLDNYETLDIDEDLYRKHSFVQDPRFCDRLTPKHIAKGVFGLPGYWKAVRALGQGGFGIAVLWELKDEHGTITNQVVTKDEYNNYNWKHYKPDSALEMSDEAYMYSWSNSLDCSNIIRMYNYLRSTMYGLHRYYLEFCAYGDLNRPNKVYAELWTRPDFQRPLPEAFIWSVAYDVAKAIFNLEKGGWTIFQPSWKIIVHSDMTPQNVFLGHPTVARVDERISEYPEAKLADFGLAERFTPEQYAKVSQETWFKMCDQENIAGWHYIITTLVEHAYPSGKIRENLSRSRGLLNPEPPETVYSQALISTLQTFNTSNPTRPGLEELVATCAHYLAAHKDLVRQNRLNFPTVGDEYISRDDPLKLWVDPVDTALNLDTFVSNDEPISSESDLA